MIRLEITGREAIAFEHLLDIETILASDDSDRVKLDSIKDTMENEYLYSLGKKLIRELDDQVQLKDRAK